MNVNIRSGLGLMLAAVVTLSACGGNSSGGSGVISPSGNSSVAITNTYAQLPAFTKPVLAVQTPGNSARWYVVEQTGHVLRFDNVASAANTSEVIDISSRVDSTSSSEVGLLGMAFHPDFPSDPRVFLYYTANVNGQLVSRLSTFSSADSGLTLDANSEHVLFTVNQPEANHKGGNLVFGADGYLYIGLGDGGGAGDMHGTMGNGQNLNTMLGKILRIDVGVNNSTTYAIPADNPYAGNPLCGTNAGSNMQPCPEIYAYGFRNPWRFSFDRQTDVLWVGDVGQDAWEEIDVVDKGGNYGWRCYEGNHVYNITGCNGTTYVAPIAEYDHSQGQAVIGGYVYRGALSVKTQGQYIYGDEVSGRIWSLPTDTSKGGATELIHSSYAISSLAQANDGELYLLDYNGGRLLQLVF